MGLTNLMGLTNRIGLVALAATLAAPGTAWGWGAPGCANLPEYNRALGALQGMTSACGMSVEQARRVVAEHDGPPPAPVRAPRRARAPQR